jgi:hypothetical protein
MTSSFSFVLCSFPEPVLAEITSHLPPKSVFFLLLSGNMLIRLKLQNGGVRRLILRSTIKNASKLVSFFPKLLEYGLKTYNKNLKNGFNALLTHLESLPKSITRLKLEHSLPYLDLASSLPNLTTLYVEDLHVMWEISHMNNFPALTELTILQEVHPFLFLYFPTTLTSLDIRILDISL